MPRRYTRDRSTNGGSRSTPRGVKNLKATDAGFVALRLLGLWFFFTGLVGIPNALSYLFFTEAESDTRLLGLGLLLVSLVILSLAAWVFVYARKVSRLLFGSAEELDVSSPHASLQAVGFSIVGAYFFVAAFPGVVTVLVKVLWVLRAGARTEREAFFSSATFFDVSYDLLWLVLGALLFLRSVWLAERWSRAQKSPKEP